MREGSEFTEDQLQAMWERASIHANRRVYGMRSPCWRQEYEWMHYTLNEFRKLTLAESYSHRGMELGFRYEPMVRRHFGRGIVSAPAHWFR